VTFITVYKTAGQRPDSSFDFSKYFLLGSTGIVVGGFTMGGCPFLRSDQFSTGQAGLWIRLWITC